MKRKIPVVIRLYEDQVHKADLLEEAKINPHRLTKELLRQPAKYAFWAAMYSMASKRVALLEEKLELLESKLFVHYASGMKRQRVSDIKYHINLNHKYRILKASLRRWKDYERHLKFAERTFQQRLSALQSINANVRREWDSEGRNKNNEGE